MYNEINNKMEDIEMKILRKSLFFAVLLVAVLFSVQAYAEAGKPNSVTIHFKRDDIPTIVEQSVEFELCDEEGLISFGTVSHQLKRGETEFDVVFNLPYYPIGTKFRLNIDDGVIDASYEGNQGSTHILETKSVEGESITEFTLWLNCHWKHETVITADGRVSSYDYIWDANEIYMPSEFFESLGIKYEPHLQEEKPYVKFYTDRYHTALLYPDDIYAVFGGEAMNLDAPIPQKDGKAYYPLSKVGVYFACNYNLLSNGVYLTEVSLTSSVYSDKYVKESTINTRNISSKTNYMIWVSKKDFQVNIFTGSQNNWTLLHTFPCSIGAPGTPTVEGQFEYYQWQPRWTYSSYYCGPIMRFYHGYAFHSYLIKYNGTPYDGRLGMRISHGCVRMHPDDIGWMAANIPLYTKVYITP